MTSTPIQASVVHLRARPTVVSNLAFGTDGIIDSRNTQLGASAPYFNLQGLYGTLGQTVPGNPAQLQFDSTGIIAAVGTASLMTLRSESLKATLDSAVAARANAYYAKYGSASAITTLANQYYSPANTGSKWQLLADLSALSAQQETELAGAYADDDISIVKSVLSTINSLTTSKGGSVSGGDVIGQDIGTDTGSSTTTETQTFAIQNQTGTQTTTTTGTSAENQKDVVSSYDQTNSQAWGSATQTQSVTSGGYIYRIPTIESAVRNDRNQVALLDEQFREFIRTQSLPNLAQILTNELAIIDLRVRRLQVAFLSTILVSPINNKAVVTAVSANPGDSVTAGEVMVRVEDDTNIYVEGTVVCGSMLSLGDSVQIQTTLFSNPSDPVTLTGTLVAVCGNEKGDNWWDVAVECSNRNSNGDQIIPRYYTFDYDDTTVSLRPWSAPPPGHAGQ
jgi:hypothetical protein